MTSGPEEWRPCPGQLGYTESGVTARFTLFTAFFHGAAREIQAMRPLTPENIESELSYAYLHAVAARAGVGCKVSNRHDDNAGVDAELTGWGPFPDGGYRQEVDKRSMRSSSVICSRDCSGGKPLVLRKDFS